MKITTFGRSMRWKLVLIYCLLVFIATTIIGVFILSQSEAYYIESIRKNLTNTVQEGTLVTTLNTYEDLMKHQAEVQSNIEAWSKVFKRKFL